MKICLYTKAGPVSHSAIPITAEILLSRTHDKLLKNIVAMDVWVKGFLKIRISKGAGVGGGAEGVQPLQNVKISLSVKKRAALQYHYGTRDIVEKYHIPSVLVLNSDQMLSSGSIHDGTKWPIESCYCR